MAPIALLESNRPASLSSSIGREHAQAGVRELLTSHRLVTLVGLGGVGKIRLAPAVAVAEGIVGDSPGGVWLVEPAAPADRGLVAATVAQGLKARDEQGRSVLETLCDHCRGKAMVPVNHCAYLLPACAAAAGALLCAGTALYVPAAGR